LAGTSIQFINDGRALLQRQLARSPVGLCGERQRAQLDSAGRRPAVGGARVQRSIGEPVVRGGLRRARLVRRRSGAWGVLGEAGGGGVLAWCRELSSSAQGGGRPYVVHGQLAGARPSTRGRPASRRSLGRAPWRAEAGGRRRNSSGGRHLQTRGRAGTGG
jgi:hypothetical protein